MAGCADFLAQAYLRAPAPSEAIVGSSPYRIVNKSRYLWLTSDRIAVSELASIDSSAENPQDMPSVFLTFRCRRCQQGRCVAAVWWDIRAINELKDKDFSTRCADCGHQDIFFGIEAIEICHGELSPIERMELDEEELQELGLNEERESKD
jgi:ribosomal protein S27E